jgi:GNAT superfamily N-acetyltransferase
MTSAIVRAPRHGEGQALALLWRELWDLHAGWGGYPASQEPRVYEHLAEKLNRDFHARKESLAEGSHIHLVAELQGRVVGQVEGWLDRYGERESTAASCEVRSLIVDEEARGKRIGKLLLETLATVAKSMSPAPIILAAEVLSPNPSYAFYTHLGFTPISTTLRFEHSLPKDTGVFWARYAKASDAFALAMLDAQLAWERRIRGDLRFDAPTAIDGARVGALASHLRGNTSGNFPADYVIQDGDGVLHGAASLALMTLDPPFSPVRRAALGRLVLTPPQHREPRDGGDSGKLEQALCALLRCVMTELDMRGARFLELTDLAKGPTDTLGAAKKLGGRPWSTIVSKFA